MNKKLAKRDTPEERELAQKREELSNLEMLLAQRGVGFDTVENDRIAKQAFFYSMEESMGMLLSFLRVLRIHRIGSQGIVISVLLALVLLGAPATGAETFDEASAAYRRGDYAVAFESFRTIAEQGHARAQYNLGVMYGEGKGVPQDDVEAVRWYQQAAEQGHADAQFNLGWMSAKGRGVPQDDAEAVRWYRLAAEQDNAIAQYNLGVMYAEGRGVPQDDAEAVRWYRWAAEQGFADAQSNLGAMYGEGRGVPQDYVEAMRWYRWAAGQGLAEAQFNLGAMYAKGEGVSQDDAEAVRWYRRAAEQGFPDAQLKLGAMYYLGTGVSKDYVQAQKWVTLAASRFSSSERQLRDNVVQFRAEVASKMTPEQIAEAQRLAREWRPEQ